MRRLLTRGFWGVSGLTLSFACVGACSSGGFDDDGGGTGGSAGASGGVNPASGAGGTPFVTGGAPSGTGGTPVTSGGVTSGGVTSGGAPGGGGFSTAGAPAGGSAGFVAGGAPSGGSAGAFAGSGGSAGAPSGGSAGTAGSAGKGGGGSAGAGSTCSSNQISCSGVCRDRLTDEANCGSCGNVCSGGRSCENGACQCAGGTTSCNNACVDTRSNASNCGSCGNVCSGGRSCVNSACACPTGRTFCSNQCVDAATDEANCGACGRACATGATCNGGTCSGGSTGGGTCSTVGSSMTVNSTIVVRSGQTYDGGCRRFIAGSSLGDGSQDEGQDPVFEIENGGTLINVVIGAPAADGVHTRGNATLRNITWEDVGEDALTIEGSGTVTLDGGSARNGEDKIFQINAASTFRLSNFRATNAGKLIRQNGGTTFTVHVFIDRCDVSNMDESIFRTDSGSSTVSMTNTRYSDIGDALFLGVSSGNVTQSGNTEY